MLNTSAYIVQFVGFATQLAATDFIERWSPFAARFKVAGIDTIDLYKIEKPSSLTYISRNVWRQEIYFKNFSNGIAANAGGGGINVQQLGGFWLSNDDIAPRSTMHIAFLKETHALSKPAYILRKACSKNCPFQLMLELAPSANHTYANQFLCTHLIEL